MSIPLFLATLLLTIPTGKQEELPLLPHSKLSQRLAQLASEHPDLATLHRVAVSGEGRALEALRVTAVETPQDHPALLLIGNLEGPRVFESAVVLHHAERVLSSYGEDEALRSLLDRTVLWFIPRANPDAAEARFGEPRHERWASVHGVDNDRDGRSGEDPASDVNGDGLVTHMRVRDPEGTWRTDPTDPRVMVEADRAKGERGEWKLYVESRDLDGDEEPGEDPPGDTRLDLNFASGWEDHTTHGGLFPTDEPEVRGLCEFVMAQRNLVLVVAYDGQDNLVEKPDSVADDAKSVQRVPPAGVLASDAALVEELGRRYRESTENESKGSGESAGTFTRWCYDHRGLITLEAVLWNLPDEAPEPEQSPETAVDEDEEEEEESAQPTQDAKHLAWIDAVGESWRFVDWTPYEHPELGAVDIGGFAPYARLEPPAAEGAAIAQAHLAWFGGLGDLLPRLALSECTLEAIGSAGGERLWRVEAALTNESYLPLLSRSMRRTRTTRPARIRLLLPQAATLVAGQIQQLVEDLSGSGGLERFSWLVHGPEGMELGVSFDSDHAGNGFRQAEVIR